jgi:glucokinase
MPAEPAEWSEAPIVPTAGGGALALAIDIGGTKLEAGLVDEAGRIVARRRADTPQAGDAEHLLAAVCAVVEEVLSATAGSMPSVVGVGCGGPMTAGGERVSPLNIPAWRDFPLRGRLAATLGTPVDIDNDAKALALAEGWIGAAAGETDFVAMVVSTGVGGGIVLEGRLLDGATGNAGHIGHLVVNPGGREHAGIAGSVEGEASGTAIAALTGHPASAADQWWRERTGRLVGRAVGGVANLLDLRLAVVAGSVALGYGADFFAAAQAECDRVARLDHSRGTRIVPAGLGADGPLVGAAAVGWRAHGRRLGAIEPHPGRRP